MFRYTFFILFLLSLSYGKIYSQNKDNTIVPNKTFVRPISSSCKSFNNKGCLVTTYEALSFTPDSVFVNYYSVSDCDTEQSYINKKNKLDKKTVGYKYQIQKKRNSPNYIIRINGFSIASLETSSNTELIEFINDPSIQKEEKISFKITDN